MVGSEWKRWELHIHTPNTKKNDQFIGKTIQEKWEKYYEDISEYIDKNNPERDIRAIAITDYLSIDNYLKVVDDNKLPNNIELVLPNVEFRLSLRGGKAPINIHCIFNSEIVDQLDDRFFSRLKFNDGTRDYSATKSELINLGRKMNPDIKDEDSALKTGIENFVIELSCLQNVFSDKELRDNTILVVANSENDGASGLKSDQYRATRNALYCLVDGIFSSKPSDVKYFLGKGVDTVQRISDLYGNIMPCYHGSDAHINSKIFEPDLNRYCYLKAETTFEGLKQTLTDPEDRVFIGKRPPVLDRIIQNPEKIIKSVYISKDPGSKGWFNNQQINFNPQLNVIIGNKGSGKTAVADILGLCSNSDRYNDFIFLKTFKTNPTAKNTRARLRYLNNIETTEKLLSSEIEDKTPSIKYLPQAYFESLTNEIEKVGKLRGEIEDIIYQYLPETVKMEVKSFNEYSDSLSVIEKSEISTLTQYISKINSQIIELENRSTTKRLKTLKSDLEEKRMILTEHLKTKPLKLEVQVETSISQEKSELEKYECKLKKLKHFKNIIETELVNKSTKKREISEFKYEINKKIKDLDDYIKEHESLLSYMGITSKQLFSYSLQVSILDEQEKAIENRIKRYNNFLSAEPNDENYLGNSLRGKIEHCEKKITDLISKESETIREVKKIEKEIEKWEEKNSTLIGDENNPNEGTINYLEEEVKYIETQLTEDLIVLEQQRIELSLEIMSKKRDIKTKLNKSTEVLQTLLDKSGESELHIANDFFISSDFSHRFLSEINQQRISTFRGTVDGQEVFESIVSEYLLEDPDYIHPEILLGRLVEELKYIKKDDKKEKVDLNSVCPNRIKLYNYLFSMEYLNSEFDLKLGEKNLDRLSPGERGAVLLIFYLLLDKDDSPLLIDQPEDNLDNQSVADVLVPYIKDAKKRRQIIMVTHNPNLAVVSDSELVIFVNLNKENHNEFSFISGGIENRLVNTKIQDILEGTPRAFRIRDSKYYNLNS